MDDCAPGEFVEGVLPVVEGEVEVGAVDVDEDEERDWAGGAPTSMTVTLDVVLLAEFR